MQSSENRIAVKSRGPSCTVRQVRPSGGSLPSRLREASRARDVHRSEDGPRLYRFGPENGNGKRYLVDPASRDMLISKIKPCMRKSTAPSGCRKLQTAHYLSENLLCEHSNWIIAGILRLIQFAVGVTGLRPSASAPCVDSRFPFVDAVDAQNGFLPYQLDGWLWAYRGYNG